MTEHVKTVTLPADEVERLEQIVDQLDEHGEVLVQTEEDAGNVAPDAA